MKDISGMHFWYEPQIPKGYDNDHEGDIVCIAYSIC